MKGLYQRFKTPAWLIISGLLTSLPLVLPKIGFLQWVSIIPMAVILLGSHDDETRLRRIYGSGVLFFYAYYAVTYHWFFYMYPLEFTGLSKTAAIGVVLVAWIGLSLFQAVQSALMFPLFVFASRSGFLKRRKMLMPFFLASLWVLFEWWQTVGWWGVPWGRLPLGQIESTVLLRSASLFGSYFITFIIVTVNFCLALAIRERAFLKAGAIIALCAFCLNLSLGLYVTHTHRESDRVVRMAAIQGNVSSSEKWDSESIEITLKAYKELTEDAAEDGARIVVWPETALPYVLFDSSILVDYVSDLAYENEVTILVSAFTRDDEGNKYNSIIEVKPDGTFGQVRYSKQHLVPFGEYVPMRDLVEFAFPPLAEIGMLEDDLVPGNESTVIRTDEGDIGCGLCFDSIYESLITGSVKNGAEVIVIATNDSWFSDSAALDMHNSQARLRAIENGRYVVRSANTGISSVIDPMGNIDGELGALKRGYVVSDVELIEERTLYSNIGNLFVYICTAFIMIVFFIGVCDRRNVKFIKKN